MAQTKADIERELKILQVKHDSLVLKVTEGVMDHTACEGCENGKRQFLEDLGLKPPTSSYKIEILLENTPFSTTKEDIKDNIHSYLDSYLDEDDQGNIPDVTRISVIALN